MNKLILKQDYRSRLSNGQIVLKGTYPVAMFSSAFIDSVVQKGIGVVEHESAEAIPQEKPLESSADVVQASPQEKVAMPNHSARRK